MLNQADIDSMADNMKIYFDVLSPDTVQITLYNKGSSPITRGKWAVYVCMLGVLDYDHLANNPKGYVLPGGGTCLRGSSLIRTMWKSVYMPEKER